MSLTIFAELSFTLYTDFHGVPFVIGHLFKFLSFWMIYRAIVQTTLKEPFSVLAQASSSYDAIPQPAVVVDRHGIISQVNRAAERYSGETSQKLIHQSVHRFFHPSDVSETACEFCQAIKEGRTTREMVSFPEKQQWALISLSPVAAGDLTQGMVQATIDITDRKLAEDALRQSQAHLQTLIETLPDLVWLKDPNGVYLTCNRKFERFFGATESQIVGKTDYDYVDRELADFFRTKDQAAMAAGKPSVNEEEVVYADDSHRELLETIKTPMFDAEGGLIGVLGVGRDITARKQAEALLRESEARFRKLFENTTAVSVQGYDKDRRVIYWNPASETLYGYSAEEAMGRLLEDLIIPDSMREHVIEATRNWMDDGVAIPSSELQLRRADGSSARVFSSHVMLRNSHNEPEMYCIDIDLTDLKLAEEQVRTLSQAIEQSPVSVVITDSKGNIEYVNKSFERISGYDANDVMGQNPRILKSGQASPEVYRELWETISNNKAWQGELQNRKKDGELFWEHANIAPVVDNVGTTRHYVAVKEDITLRKQQEEMILHQAHYDALTNLPNRFLVLDRLSQQLKEAERTNTSVAVLFLDLDDFKKVNDTLGHEVGDKLLVDAASRLRTIVRSSDTVGRLGGDEFIVVIANLGDASDARTVAENLVDQFRDAFRIDGREMLLTISIGIAAYPQDGTSASEILRNADSAMYHAKNMGRNTYAYFTEEMNQDVSRRLLLEEQLHGALDRGEFDVHYQPQVKVSSGELIGAEALLRWHNPALGQVSPEEFIPIAEQTGLIVSLGKFVLTQALRVAARWQERQGVELRMAVNLSPRQFRDSGLVAFVEQAVHQAGVSFGVLELEITEGVLMSGQAVTGETLSALSNLGVHIAMDDFGTGYSSLSYLRNYPFDVLKIDRSFINDITEDASDRELVNASVTMAHGLGLKVVAEGVETEEQLRDLKELGCDFAQGYLFSKPVPEEEILVSQSHSARQTAIV